MKLCRTVICFPADGRSVILQSPDSDYKVTHRMVKNGLRLVLDTEVTPEPDGDDLPDDLECMLAESILFESYISHYLTCEKHAGKERLMICDAHDQMERAKQRYPMLTETMYEAQVAAISTGVLLNTILSLGLVDRTTLVNSEPNELEKAILERGPAEDIQPVPGMSMFKVSDVASVVLDYQTCDPPLTDADREELKQLYLQILDRAKAPNTFHITPDHPKVH